MFVSVECYTGTAVMYQVCNRDANCRATKKVNDARLSLAMTTSSAEGIATGLAPDGLVALVHNKEMAHLTPSNTLKNGLEQLTALTVAVEGHPLMMIDARHHSTKKTDSVEATRQVI